jgi:hypothetical protein
MTVHFLRGIAMAVLLSGSALAAAGEDDQAGLIYGPFNAALEQRLRRQIEASLSPPPPAQSPSQPDRILPWANPVGGLTARIEYVGSGGYSGLVVMVRLKNVSDKVLVVPTGNPEDSAKPPWFELYQWHPDGLWTRRPWDSSGQSDPPVSAGAGLSGVFAPAPEREPPLVALKPQESCLACLSGVEILDDKRENDVYTPATSIKVVLRQPASQQSGRWQGSLETPPRAPATRPEALATNLPMPEHFPEFSRETFPRGNEPGFLPAVFALRNSNYELLQALEMYDAIGVRREFERRMLVEKDVPVKLLMAAVAARAGSRTAALFLLEIMRDTDEKTVRNLHVALGMVLTASPADPPNWILGMVLTALCDRRRVKNETVLTISDMAADEFLGLTEPLAYVKCRKAVPCLIEIAKRTQGAGGPVRALGEIGDPRAIPVLIESLKRAGKTDKYEEGDRLGDDFLQSVEALAHLKAKEAVPALIAYVEFPEVIEALERIGDPTAAPAIRKVLAATKEPAPSAKPRKGKAELSGDNDPFHDAINDEPTLEQKRRFAARLALLALEVRDPIPQLCAMLGEQSRGELQRLTVVWRLGDRPDPRAIPFLVNAIKSDASGAVRGEAIEFLSVFKYKAAVEGLIGCFDVDFRGKDDGKRAYEPAMFRANIAESLRGITGQPFGADKAQWLRWWREKGSTTAELK